MELNSFAWIFDQNPRQTSNSSMIVAFLKDHGIQRIERGESVTQWKERDAYDGNYGDGGLSWLINGLGDLAVDDLIIAWVEITPPKIGS